MEQLATLYRAAQFFAHNAHNLAKGATFFEDHEELGDLYPVYESAYDSLVERMIGAGKTPDFKAILSDATELANKVGPPGDNNAAFLVLLSFERKFQDEIKRLVDAGQTDGTENLLQGLADEGEVRGYKLGQRTK